MSSTVDHRDVQSDLVGYVDDWMTVFERHWWLWCRLSTNQSINFFASLRSKSNGQSVVRGLVDTMVQATSLNGDAPVDHMATMRGPVPACALAPCAPPEAAVHQDCCALDRLKRGEQKAVARNQTTLPETTHSMRNGAWHRH